MEYHSRSPADGALIDTFPFTTGEQLDAALAAACEGARLWRQADVHTRAGLLERVADSLGRQWRAHAATMAVEMGKPIAQGQAEIEKCAWVCRHMAEHAPAWLAPEPHGATAAEAAVHHAPLGPVLAIMPWNFPFWQVFRFAAAALMAGNVVVLKPAPSTPRCALSIQELFDLAGAPPAVLQTLFLDLPQVTHAIEDARIRAVTITGSTGAGRSVAEAAGRSLKPIVLELGGSDPFVVCADADLDAAVQAAVTSRCLNSGQSCIAAKRFFVDRPVYERFVDAFVEAMSAQVVGQPTKPGVDIGPLARADLRDTLARQVAASLEAGARALCGGEVPKGPGFYYPPTVLVDTPPSAPAACEELFGPVAPVWPFEGDEQVVALANGTALGLGASVWTRDRARAEALAEGFEAGAVFVNDFVKSDPRQPFGGVKDSGYGRELGRDGVHAFVNRKTVVRAAPA